MMKYLKLTAIAFTSLSLLVFVDCSKKKQVEEEEMSADDIIEQAPAPEIEKPVVPEKKPAIIERYSPSFSENGPYVVQVKSYPNEASANNFMQKLLDKGYPSYVARVENPTAELPGSYFRVRVGGFNGLSEAREFGEKIIVEEMGLTYWVDNKSNDTVAGNAAEEESTYGTTSGSSWNAAPATPATSTWGAEPAAPAPAAPATSTWGNEPAAAPAPAAPAASGWGNEPAAAPAPAAPAPTPEPAPSTPSNDWGTGSSETTNTPTPTPAPAQPSSGNNEFEF
ncbi:MAG: hypothetical protein A2293_09715 [Elusimicrobia bacterium RIFOXYB2_FULL_49_7]|nr:MAG: hypothetical protein A2293_09715 [Elusimicrobia bacterium RIFOXYB2_FULL_49_7]